MGVEGVVLGRRVRVVPVPTGGVGCHPTGPVDARITRPLLREHLRGDRSAEGERETCPTCPIAIPASASFPVNSAVWAGYNPLRAV